MAEEERKTKHTVGQGEKWKLTGARDACGTACSHPCPIALLLAIGRPYGPQELKRLTGAATNDNREVPCRSRKPNLTRGVM